MDIVSKYRSKIAVIGVVAIAILAMTAVIVVPAVAGTSHDSHVMKPFFAVSEELESELEQIVMADTEIQDLVRDREYRFEVDDEHVVMDKGYNLAVGAWLKKDVNSKQLKDWIDGGSQDETLIDKFAGCLTLGYNEMYTMSISRAKGRVENLTMMNNRTVEIPELSRQEKDTALQIAFSDPDLTELLKGKKYEIAPNGRIGVWHTSPTEDKGIKKMGVAFDIQFSQPYQIDYNCPGTSPSDEIDSEPQYYVETFYRYSDLADSLSVLVDIETGRVVSIEPSKAPQ